MMDHVGVQCDDLAASRRFYEHVLEPLGFHVMIDHEVALGFGDGTHPRFWIGERTDEQPNRPSHLAFEAPSRGAVVAFYQRAVDLGLESLHEPRVWPEYHPGYYGAFVRDPDGNNVEAVHHTVGPA